MRWPDWLLLIASGVLVWDAASAFRATRVTLSQPSDEGVYRDTYYVVANAHVSLTTLTAVILVLAVYIFVIRRAVPALSAYGACSIVAAMIGGVLWTAPQLAVRRQDMPRSYTDYPDTFELWAKISTVGATVTLLAAVAFLVVTLLAVIHIFRR